MKVLSDNHRLIKEIRDFLASIDQKISHLLEQNKIDRCLFRWEKEECGGDEDGR